MTINEPWKSVWDSNTGNYEMWKKNWIGIPGGWTNENPLPQFIPTPYIQPQPAMDQIAIRKWIDDLLGNGITPVTSVPPTPKKTTKGVTKKIVARALFMTGLSPLLRDLFRALIDSPTDEFQRQVVSDACKEAGLDELADIVLKGWTP